MRGIRIIPTEDQEQIAVFEWANLLSGRYPELDLMYHIPNGGKRSKSEAARFKAMGVKPGVSDICLPVARGKYHGLYIELKALDGKPSQKQKDFIEKIKLGGYFGIIAYGAEEAIDIIKKYLEI